MVMMITICDFITHEVMGLVFRTAFFHYSFVLLCHLESQLCCEVIQTSHL